MSKLFTKTSFYGTLLEFLLFVIITFCCIKRGKKWGL
jgi:hypothetical protein